MWRLVIAFSGSAFILAGCAGAQIPAASNETSNRIARYPYHETFKYSGRKEAFIVPPGVTSIEVVALGGAGGHLGCLATGLQGRVRADVAVTPGERLLVVVGGGGNGHKGGFNGGGDGGGLTYGGVPATGGGGASDVRVNPGRLSDRVVVAGGGGGQSPSNDDCSSGTGGNGGGEVGQAGLGGEAYSLSAGGGGGGMGGSQSMGGAGGAGGGYGSGSSGVDGTFGFGGAGGSCAGTRRKNCYYGGEGAGGGGGGGSSYIEPGATDRRSWQGWRDIDNKGNGLIVISWE